MEEALLFGLFVAVVIAIRLIAGSINAGRIERYFRTERWELVERNWDPFGPGWCGGNLRIYKVSFRDQDGNLRPAYVKTSMFAGVYLTNDEVVERTKTPPVKLTGEALVEENERLKARVEDLKEKFKSNG